MLSAIRFAVKEMEPASTKNRNREAPTFANINLLGRCNADCYFCLGKDIAELLSKHDQCKVHFSEWRDFDRFLELCRRAGISKLYITGQNTDSLLYAHLGELVDTLQASGFQVGLRTNGLLALRSLDVINRCQLETGYTIESLDAETTRQIMGIRRAPNWQSIIPATARPRVQIVITRYNADEFDAIVRYVASFPNVKYMQVRRVSTDTRLAELQPDIDAYEILYTKIARCHPLSRRLWSDAEEYILHGLPCVFWRTVRTSINSYNYFTDGTIATEYFVVEGYLKNYAR